MPRPLLLLVTTRTYRAAAFLRAAERAQVPVIVASDQPQAWRTEQPPGLVALDFGYPDLAAEGFAGSPQADVQAVLAAEDEGVIAAAALSARLNLAHNSLEAVGLTRDKARFRQRLEDAGLGLNPRFWVFPLDTDPEEAAGQVEYPCVLKPRSLAGSRGVIRADDPGQFVAAFRRTAGIIRTMAAGEPDPARTTLLVEGYLPGSEHALEGLLLDGQLKPLALFDKPDPLEGPFFEETIYVTPSRLGLPTQHRIETSVQQAVAALGLTHGPLHAEMRVEAQHVWILEIAARSIGGLCSRALRFEGGRSLEEVLLLHAAGRPLPSLQLEPAASGVMMIPIPGAGTLRQVSGVETAAAVPGVTDVVIELRPGEPVVPLPEGGAYLGFLFAEGATPASVEAALRQAHACLSVELSPS
jgi:biotin carboxylase